MDDTFIVLCDWRGHCTWTNSGSLQVKVGEFIWEHLSAESQKDVKSALGKVVALRESQQLEIVDQKGNRCRAWLWPLNSPEMAVCSLGIRIPSNLSLLSQRERDCLELLAVGTETRLIAEKFDLSISTIHTHLKHAREKLDLPSIEALISFAARYCFPVNQPLDTRIGQGP